MYHTEGWTPQVDIDTERWLNGEDIIYPEDSDPPNIYTIALTLEPCDCEDFNPQHCDTCNEIAALAS